MFQALRVRDFRLLWAGDLVSDLGSWLLVLAVPAHVFLVTGSLRATGLTLAAEYLPILLLGPAAGVIADRCDRRRLMIGASLACAAAVALMLAGLSPGRYWVLYAALVAENSGIVLCAPAWQARIPAIVGTGPLLSSAGALNAVSSGTVRLIGGPLGGVLLAAAGIRWLICADAASYLLAAGAIALTSRSDRYAPVRVPARHDRPARPWVTVLRRLSAVALHDLSEGIRCLRREPPARTLLPVTAAFLAANASLSAVLIPFALRRLGGSGPAGFLLAALGAGFLAGAPVIRWLVDRVQPRTLLAVTLSVNAAACLALFTSSALATALPAAVAVGLSGSMTLTAAQVTLQRVVPNAVLGRVTAVFLTAEAAVTLAGAVAGPVLAQSAGLPATAAVAAAVMLLAAALARLTIPRLATLIPLPQPEGTRSTAR
jgi:predicted MFS family arabinose efflux permease